MFRLIGAALVIGATGAFGLGSMQRLGARVRVLRGLITAVQTTQSEICDRLTPLPALIAQLAAEATPPVDQFFHRLQGGMAGLGERPFSAIWKQTLEGSPELHLGEGAYALFADLGKTLGRYDIEDQRHVLRYTARRLEGYLEQAEEQRRERGKVHAVLGVAAGVFVVLILL